MRTTTLDTRPRQPINFSRAMGLYSLQSGYSSMVRTEVNLSELLVSKGQFASAEEHLERSLRYCDEEGGVDRRNRTYAMVGGAAMPRWIRLPPAPSTLPSKEARS